MRNKWNLWLACAAVLSAQVAHAGSTADELARIEAEHVVLKARLRLAETQAQIASRRAEIERQGSVMQLDMPTVAGIEGMDGKFGATLQFESGFLSDVRVGDTLPNGLKVVSIASQGVVVQTTDRKRVRLRSAGEPSGLNLAPPAPRIVGVPPSQPGVVQSPPVMSLPPLPSSLTPAVPASPASQERGVTGAGR